MPLRYKLDDLGWYQFEALCQSILLNKFAVGIQAWGGSADYGRDAYYRGDLPIPDDASGGTQREFVFQAKFVENANAAGASPRAAIRKAVVAEIVRIRGRASRPDCYVLLTNVSLTAELRSELEELLRAAMPAASIVTWGERELSGLLDGLRDVRLSFPQVLGLADLQELVSGAVNQITHERSTGMLARAAEDAPVFVRTEIYYKAYSTLLNHYMAVLTGPPEMGKTTLAYAIAFERAASGWQTFAIRSAAELLVLYKRDGLQLFIADDAFGATEYKPGLAEAWAPEFDEVFRRLDQQHWIIWTSRTAPLEAALRDMHLQGRAERFPDPGRLFVNATTLSVREKALMLYAHAKAALLSAEARELVRGNANAIVRHAFFTPKRVQRFVAEKLTSGVPGQKLSSLIEDEMRAPTKAMRNSFNALSDVEKAVLVSALDGPNVEAAFERHRPEGCTAIASEVQAPLFEHFIMRRSPQDLMWSSIVTDRLQKNVTWTHPSWRDLLIDYVAEAEQRRQAFLSRCSLGGFELALSTAGGAAGERRRPFLRTERDWEILGGRIEGIVRELDDDEEPRDFLALLRDTFQNADPTGVEEERFNRWGGTALDALRGRWDGAQTAILVSNVALYYEVSEWVRPLRAGPDLRKTWDAVTSDARQESNSPDWYTEFPAIRAWLELVKLLHANEPRFLRQTGFPDAYEGLVEKLVGECEEYVNGEPDLSYREDYETEIDQLEHIEAAVSSVGAAFSTLSDRCDKLRQRLKLAQSRYKRLLDDAETRARRAREADRVPSRLSASDDIDIDRLFSDL